MHLQSLVDLSFHPSTPFYPSPPQIHHFTVTLHEQLIVFNSCHFHAPSLKQGPLPVSSFTQEKGRRDTRKRDDVPIYMLSSGDHRETWSNARVHTKAKNRKTMRVLPLDNDGNKISNTANIKYVNMHYIRT